MPKLITTALLISSLSAFARPDNRCQSQAEMLVRTAHLISDGATNIQLKRKKFRFDQNEEMESYEIELLDGEEGYELDISYRVDLTRYGHGQCKVKSLTLIN